MDEEGKSPTREAAGPTDAAPADVPADEDEEGAADEEARTEERQAESDSDSGSEGDDESLPTAPSLGPNTTIEREPVEERLARHEQSEVDARGKDKRRAVVGKTYGPTKSRQLLLYGLALAVIVALAIGGKLLINALDTPVGKDIPNSAPWAQPGAKQHPPKPLQ